MQQLMMQAQKMQRELAKAQAELESKVFSTSKNGMVKITVLGTKEVQSIDIEKDALEPDNKEMIEEAIKMALQELFEQIDEEAEEINNRIGAKMPLGF